MSRTLTPQSPSQPASSLTPHPRALADKPAPSATQVSGKTSKLPWKRDRDGVRKMKELVMQALGVLENLTNLATEISDNAGIPGLSAGLSGVAEVLRRIQMMSTTIKGVETLKERLGELVGGLQDFASLPRDVPLPDAMRARLEALVCKWAQAGINAHNIKERHWFKRLWRSDADAAELQGLVEMINTSIFEFIFQGALVVEENVLRTQGDVIMTKQAVSVVKAGVDVVIGDVEGVREDVRDAREDILDVHESVVDVKEGVGGVQRDVSEIKEDVRLMKQGVVVTSETIAGEVKLIRKEVKAVRANLDASFLPVYAKKAQFDANEVRRGCLENTRVDILERLRHWITESRVGNVFWINGSAGTGKTTIAYSVAQLSKKAKVLGASFFFSHSDAECSDASLVIVTIARQLCRYHAPYKEQVDAVLQQDPDVVHSNLARQFEELIVEPLEALNEPFPRAVVVLDALDECKDKGATAAILTVLAKFISRVKDHLLFLVTSRPEPHITAVFSKAREDSLADATTLLLHEEELKSVSDDIRRYLLHEFKERAGMRQLPKDWPSTQDIETLVVMSHGLFIWAVTAVLFIMGSVFSHPPEQLRSLVDKQASSEMKTPYAVLESLYKQITETASTLIPDDYKDRVRLILGTIAVAQEPLSIDSLAALLGIGDSTMVNNLLLGMHSVLRVPDEPSEPVRVIHPTFPEFLLASSVSKPDAFNIKASILHCTLFARSLAVMVDLKQDIANIGDPMSLRSEIPTLAEEVRRRIPLHLRYVCRYWGNHLQGAADSPGFPETIGSFRQFLLCYFLNWLEACSLTEALDSAVNALDTARLVFQSMGEPYAEFVPLVVDFHHFLLTFIGCIDAAPLQLYHSALAQAPSTSRVMQIYGGDIRNSVVVCRGEMQDWGACLDVFKGHNGSSVFCAALSPDGNFFATGGENFKIAIRRSTTRKLLQSIGEHHGDINAVAFSPDKIHIASASDDKTIGIWRVSSGDSVWTLEGHTDTVCSVTYSKDGSRILSASPREVILWDVSDGRRLLTLPTSVDYTTWQVGLSPDGGTIAHRSDSGLSAYDVASKTHTYLPLPSPAHVATFSPDGRYIAAASETTIGIWTAQDNTLVRYVNISSFPFRLAFSHDGTRIACGLKDCSVYVWQVGSVESPLVFEGHTDWVYDVVWSLDDTRMITTSGDSNVRVWDTTRGSGGDTQRQLFAPSLPSPDSRTLLCRGDSIHIIHVPNASEVEPLPAPGEGPSLSLHPDVPQAWNMAFSSSAPVSDFAMTWCMRSRDWEFLTGKRYIRVNRRPVSVTQDISLMAYLPEGINTEVSIYNFRTEKVVAELTGHTDYVRSVDFSSDGSLLVTGSEDATVNIWDIASAALVTGHNAHADWVFDAAFSSDDRLVVSGARDGTARVYDIAAAHITHVFDVGISVGRVAFSADDRYILTLDYFRDVSIWDLSRSSRICEVSLAGSTWTRSLDFTPDGTGILVRGSDGETLVLFNIHEASTRSWPAYHVSDDGWVTAKSPGRAHRLCWLRPEWRAIFPLGGAMFCALDLDRKLSVVFDVSRTTAYAENWGRKD